MKELSIWISVNKILSKCILSTPGDSLTFAWETQKEMIKPKEPFVTKLIKPKESFGMNGISTPSAAMFKINPVKKKQKLLKSSTAKCKLLLLDFSTLCKDKSQKLRRSKIVPIFVYCPIVDWKIIMAKRTHWKVLIDYQTHLVVVNFGVVLQFHRCSWFLSGFNSESLKFQMKCQKGPNSALTFTTAPI